jgi:hypothetical protein
LQNSGTTRFQGLELAADLRAPHAVTGRVTYSFHDATFVDFVQSFDGVNTQLAGKRFEMSARHLFSAGLIVAPRNGLVGDVIVKYSGDRTPAGGPSRAGTKPGGMACRNDDGRAGRIVSFRRTMVRGPLS